ncbi:hypothetical protein CV770_26635 [Bradyrhizobium sp. AC87j1]|uniref:hypothetical protein n=1 Tax=Bradyrhizobium sp. AC87j1 TaxID=2055894 RepID=UPI000CEBE892|nr:hypothetical protein [Bradyrhizobium sp. AC87j1]PPQ16326.1 hypothetical protein CV770_26635 [Bradyrhizobium sp. AC87j1]
MLTGCASAPPPTPPAPIALIGTLDLSKPGVDFLITDAPETLRCSAHSVSGKIPEAVSLPLTCENGQAGTLSLTKAPALRGIVAFDNGTTGDVTFTIPAAALQPPPPVATAAPGYPSTVSRTYSRSHYSTGYVRPHYRSGGYVRPHLRNGHYVSGHYRRGSYVRGHYRRR